MFYYIIRENNIIKYEIEIDIDSLKKLRSEIINKCSLIIHKHYITTRRPDHFDYEHIRNYNEKKIQTIEYEDFYYSRSVDEYLVDYNYYEHPELVSLIDLLIKGNTSVIEKIKNTTDVIVDEEKKLIEEQTKIIKKINSLSTKDISKELELLNKIQEKLLKYLEQKQLNKNQVSVNNYIEKVLNCVNYTKISRISLEAVLEVQKFLDDATEISTSNELNKTLKLQKRKQN